MKEKKIQVGATVCLNKELTVNRNGVKRQATKKEKSGFVKEIDGNVLLMVFESGIEAWVPVKDVVLISPSSAWAKDHKPVHGKIQEVGSKVPIRGHISFSGRGAWKNGKGEPLTVKDYQETIMALEEANENMSQKIQKYSEMFDGNGENTSEMTRAETSEYLTMEIAPDISRHFQ